MKQISFVKDIETGDLYGFIIRDGDSATAIGATPHAKTWANWANHSKMLSDQMTKSLDVTLQKSESFDLSTKRLEVLKSRLPRELFDQIVDNADDEAMIIRGTRHKTMGARFISKSVSQHKHPYQGVASRPLSSFSLADRKAAMEYKAVFAETRQKYSTLNIQVKKNRAVFDSNIGPGGGWRCPDGTLYGGRITDRFGRGCGGGLTRRIGRAIMNAGRRLDDLGETMDQRRSVRRAARVERQADRRQRAAKKIQRVSDSLESLAQALVGDYQPLEGITPRRKRRRGAGVVDGDLPDTDVPRARRRKLVPSKPKRTVVADDLKKKPSGRKKRGAEAKPTELTPRVRKLTESLAQRLVGDYEPLEGIEPKRRGRRGDGDDRTLFQKFQDAIERFVSRLIGDYEPLEGISPRRERRRREVEKKVPTPAKKPSAKKTPAKKTPAKKPRAQKPKKKDRVAEINDQLKLLSSERMTIEAKEGAFTQKEIARLKEIEKERAALLVEKAKLESADPMPQDITSPAKPKKPKPAAPSKVKVGKQYGGAFKDGDNAKAKAVERSMETGQSLVVVRGDDDKFRIVDAERLNDDDSLMAMFAVTPEGGFVEWDNDLSFDDNMKVVKAAIDLEEKDIIEELKPVPVEDLDLELKKSKTGSFLPDALNSIMLENHRKGADADFRKAFHEQRLKNWSFWKNQVGEDKFEDVADAKGALALIDAHYEKVSKTEPVDEALLGMLRAERKNFLAMWVPDEGMDEVNFYERFNYVNPKRRQAIVQQANVGEMLVGKKKKADKPKKPNVDAPINPDKSVVPEADAPEVPKTPDAPEQLSVPGKDVEPSKVLNLGENPGKYVMSYKQGLRSTIVNLPEDKKTSDILYKSNDEIDEAAKLNAQAPELHVLNLEDAQENLSELRGELSKKITDGETVTENDVIKLIRAENKVRFYQTAVDQDNAIYDASVKAEESQLAALQAKIDADKTNVQLAQQKNFTEAAQLGASFELDNEKLLSNVDDLDALKADPDGYISALDDDLSSKKFEANAALSEMHQKVSEGTATEDDIQSAIAKQGQVQRLAEVVEALKKKSAAGTLFPSDSDDGDSAEFNPFRADFDTYQGDTTPFDTFADRSAYQQKLDELFVAAKIKDANAHSAGEKDGTIVARFGKEDGTVDQQAILDKLNELGKAYDGVNAANLQKMGSGELSPNDLELKYLAMAEIEKTKHALTRSYAINAELKKKNEDDSLTTPDLMPDADLPDDLTDGLPDVEDMESAIKESIDNFTPTKATIASAKSKLISDAEFGDLTSEDDINAYYDYLDARIAGLSAPFEIVALADEPNYGALNAHFGSEEEFNHALAVHKHKKALTKWVAVSRISAIESLADSENTDAPDKPKTINPDSPGDAAGHVLSHLKASAPDFKYDTQKEKQEAKGKTMQGQISNADYGTDLLDSLPVDFYDLSAQEQIDVLQNLTGKNNPNSALGEIYKTYILRSNGDKESLQILQTGIDNPSDQNLVTQILQATSTNSLQDAIDVAASDLDAATEKLGAATDEILKLRAMRDVSTARNKYIAALSARMSDPSLPDSEKKLVYQELKKYADFVPEDKRSAFKQGMLNIKDVQSKPSDKNTGSGMLSTPDFDPVLLGSTSDTGDAVAQTIPVGNAGIFDVEDASTHVSTGGALSQVPDDFLRDSIVANLGENKRFQPFQITQGFNHDNFAVVDSVTGKKYIIKTEDRNHMGHIQEALGAHLANELGFPTPGIRFGSALKDTDLPGPQKSAEGVTQGRGRVMVIEHLENQFPNNKVASLHQIPAGEQLSGESIARMMVLDRTMNYFDRTTGNMFVVQGSDGKWHLHPIDHGNAFRDWGGSGTEQAAGFTKVVKGDNVDLMGLVSKLSPDEKEKWANALNKTSRKVAKIDMDSALKAKLTSGNIVSNEDVERLDKHISFLKTKQSSLDWDAMTTSALAKAGYSQEEISDILTGGPAIKKFAVDQGDSPATTAVEKMKAKSGTRNFGHVMLWDGEDIEGFAVRAQDIKTTGMPDADGNVGGSGKIATMLNLKLRGDAHAKMQSELENPEANGWTYLTTGKATARYSTQLGAKAGESKTFNFNNPKTSPGDEDVNTYRKVMPDGTVILATKTSNTKSSYHATYSVILPGKSDDVLNDANVTSALSNLGVKNHGNPTPEDVRNYGVMTAGRAVLGASNLTGNEDIDDMLDALTKAGIDPEGISMRPTTTGELKVMFSPEDAKKLKEKYKLGPLYHDVMYKSDSSVEEKFLSILATGSLGSTTTRFNGGIGKAGGSSAADAKNKGSADYVFLATSSETSAGSFSNGKVYTPPELMMAYADMYTQQNDAWGELNARWGHDKAFQATAGGNQMMVRDSVPASSSIYVTSNASSVIQNLQAIGITEIDGVPVSDIVVTSAEADAAYQKLLSRLKAEGIIA